METKKSALGPATRLEIGAVVLEGALHADTTPVKGHLSAFATVQRGYGGAQRKVEGLEDLFAETQKQVVLRDIEQDEAVEAVARAMVTDGRPRSNPFAELGIETPTAVKKLPCADQAKAIDRLVAAVERSKTVSQATRDAAQVAQKAARAMEAALAKAAALQTRLDKARRRRDAIGEKWDRTYAALKHRAVSADDGGAGIHAPLFGRLVRRKRKKKTATPAATPVTTPAAEPTAAVATTAK